MLLYRGFNNNYPNMGVKPNQKGIWMTDDEEYANEYANMFVHGSVVEADVDITKSKFLDEETGESIFGEDFNELGCGETDIDGYICDEIIKMGYDGIKMEQKGSKIYLIVNRNILKNIKIIKEFENDPDNDEFMESTINNILKNAGVKQLNESIEIRDEVIDVHGEEFYKEMALIVDDKIVGCIQYTVYDDKPYIQMIKVAEDERRKGYGTKLIKALQKEYPNSEIDFGMTTDDGTKLVNSLPFDTKVNIEYDKKVKQAKKLKKWLDEFKEFTDKVYQQIDNNEPIAEKNRLYIVNNTDKWQKYKNKYEEILNWIRENKREKKFVKVDENSKNLNESIFWKGEKINNYEQGYYDESNINYDSDDEMIVWKNPSAEWVKVQIYDKDEYFRFVFDSSKNDIYMWYGDMGFHMDTMEITGADGDIVGTIYKGQIDYWGEEDTLDKINNLFYSKRKEWIDIIEPNGYDIDIQV